MSDTKSVWGLAPRLTRTLSQINIPQQLSQINLPQEFNLVKNNLQQQLSQISIPQQIKDSLNSEVKKDRFDGQHRIHRFQSKGSKGFQKVQRFSQRSPEFGRTLTVQVAKSSTDPTLTCFQLFRIIGRQQQQHWLGTLVASTAVAHCAGSKIHVGCDRRDRVMVVLHRCFSQRHRR